MNRERIKERAYAVACVVLGNVLTAVFIFCLLSPDRV
jgi:hypothetical protein